MKKKHLLIILIVVLSAFLLAGCGTPIDENGNYIPITAEADSIWEKFFVWPLSWLITTTAGFLNNNYGVAIIVVTIAVRFAVLPLSIKSTKSQKAMQAIQPQLDALKQKYSSKDQATQAKLQQETMALFQQHGVNPLSGCLPMLIQMPILIAFYQAILRTPEIANHTFLWFDLGEPDPYFILPILAAVTTYLQSKLSAMGQDPNSPAAQQMKIMMWVMPIMILIFALNLPAALSMYWVVGNVFGCIQTYMMRKPVDLAGGK